MAKKKNSNYSGLSPYEVHKATVQREREQFALKRFFETNMDYYRQGPKFNPPVPAKPAREVWRSPHIDDILKPRPMRPEDYDRSKTINVPKRDWRKTARDYAKKAGKYAKYARPFSPYGRAWDLWDMFDHAWRDVQKRPVPVPNPLNGWVIDYFCSWAKINCSSFKFKTCIGGQSPVGSVPAVPPAAGATTYGLWERYRGGFLNFNATRVSFWRPSAVSNPYPNMSPSAWAPPAPNPNALRWEPDAQPNMAREHDAVREAMRDAPASQLAEAPAWNWNREIDLASGSSAPPVTPHRYATRTPPSKGTRERKAMPATKALGIALWKAMDNVSEAAEVVDAFYEALDDKVKERWNCGANTGNYLAHTAGQYGIDHADCKLRALWHNWEKVDLEQAFRNVVKNQIEDKIIGGYQSKLPKNTGNVLSDGDKAVSQALDWFFKEIGL